ncbi:hypothetical protein [Moorena producens]|uniref:hypothetical protein n=1 Tax=Moorena producens TaxID=1155739 RepID=UPI003C78159D
MLPAPYSLLPTPYSLLPIPYSLFPIPYSLLPTPYSLFPFTWTMSMELSLPPPNPVLCDCFRNHICSNCKGY